METAVAERKGRVSVAIVDDDDLSREVLALIAAEAGLACESFATGEEALAWLVGGAAAAAVVCDMQMPGLSGNELGWALRAACGEGTRLLAMSGSAVAKDRVSAFDGFLLKPISAEDFAAAVEGETVLNGTVYGNFAKSLPAARIAELYRMCVNDARKRVETMRWAAAAGDEQGYRRAAHAIKGGCGMVGASELAEIAASCEEEGIAGVYDGAPFDRFEAAAARLERMLESKSMGH